MSRLAVGVARWLRAAAVVTVLVGGLGAPVAMASGGPDVATVATSTPAAAPALTSRMTAITPNIATVGQPVAVQVSVTNTGTQPLTRGSLIVRLSRNSLTSREGLSRWLAEGTGTGFTHSVEQRISGTLAPGATSLITATIPGSHLRSDRPFGVFPMSLEVRFGSVASTRATVLPFFRIKEFQPLAIAFAAPLTPDPDPDLVAEPGPEREKAWTRTAGRTSRLARIVDATADHPVTWAIDPGLLPDAIASKLSPSLGEAGVSATPTQPAGTPAAAGGNGVTSSGGPAETQARADMAARVTADPALHPLWQLPIHDPDVSALLQAGLSSADLGRLVRSGASLTQLLSTRVNEVSWPLAVPLEDDQRRLVEAYGARLPSAELAPVSAIDPDSANVGSAPRRTATGMPMLAYDEPLSQVFGGIASMATPAETAQRFIADTAMLLAQAPGRERTVLVLAPRGFDPDPATMTSLFTAIGQSPWLRVASTPELEAGLAKAPLAPARTTPAPSPTETGSPAGPTTPASPLHPDDITQMLTSQQHVQGIAGIIQGNSPRLTAAAQATAVIPSSRWRGQPAAFEQLRRTQKDSVDAVTAGVTVLPSTVNFFADSGLLQFTVTNTLDADVTGVRLAVDPDNRQSRLRILRQPDPLTIRRNSRITVRLPVEAIAPGVVPIATRLSTPDGTLIGADSVVRVQVRPANGWVLLVIGAGAALVFLVGIYRALRAGSPRVPPSQLEEIDVG